jgi:hypothetical protein
MTSNPCVNDSSTNRRFASGLTFDTLQASGIWKYIKMNGDSSSLCSMCQNRAARYRCPGCHTRTCSVECVRAHKAKSSCTGKRDRTKFEPVSAFDDNKLYSGACMRARVRACGFAHVDLATNRLSVPRGGVARTGQRCAAAVATGSDAVGATK